MKLSILLVLACLASISFCVIKPIESNHIEIYGNIIKEVIDGETQEISKYLYTTEARTYWYDQIQYSASGKYAIVVRDATNNKILINFYEKTGEVIGHFVYTDDDNETIAEDGLCISLTPEEDQIFIAYTIVQSYTIIKGLIINELGEQVRGSDAIIVLGDYFRSNNGLSGDNYEEYDEYYHRHRPQCALSGNTIFVAASSYRDSTTETGQNQHYTINVQTIDVTGTDDIEVLEADQHGQQVEDIEETNPVYFNVVSMGNDDLAVILQIDTSEIFYQPILSGTLTPADVRVVDYTGYTLHTGPIDDLRIQGAQVPGTDEFIFVHQNQDLDVWIVKVDITDRADPLIPSCSEAATFTLTVSDFTMSLYDANLGYLTYYATNAAEIQELRTIEFDVTNCQLTGLPSTQYLAPFIDNVKAYPAKTTLLFDDIGGPVVFSVVSHDFSDHQVQQTRITLTEYENCTGTNASGCTGCDADYAVDASNFNTCQLSGRQGVQIINGGVLDDLDSTKQLYLGSAFEYDSGNSQWPEPNSSANYREVVQFDDNGDFAVIMVDIALNQIYISRYQYNGLLLDKQKIVADNDFNGVGEHGICAVSTGNNDEIFIAFTIQQNDRQSYIKGGIIDSQGNVIRNAGYINVMSIQNDKLQTMYKPRCDRSDGLIYITAVGYKTIELVGDEYVYSDPALYVQTIDISDDPNPISAQGQGQQVNRDGSLLVPGNTGLVGLGDDKAVIIWVEDTVPQTVYLKKIDDGTLDEEQYAINHTNYEFEQLQFVNASRLGQSQRFVLVYDEFTSNEFLFIATFSYYRLSEPFCLKQMTLPQEQLYQGYFYHPDVYAISQTQAYVTYDIYSSNYNSYVIEINPETCALEGDPVHILPLFSTQQAQTTLISSFGRMALAQAFYGQLNGSTAINILYIDGLANCETPNANGYDCDTCIQGANLTSNQCFFSFVQEDDTNIDDDIDPFGNNNNTTQVGDGQDDYRERDEVDGGGERTPMEFTEAEEDDEELELVVDKILNQDTFTIVINFTLIYLSLLLIFQL